VLPAPFCRGTRAGSKSLPPPVSWILLRRNSSTSESQENCKLPGGGTPFLCTGCSSPCWAASDPSRGLCLPVREARTRGEVFAAPATRKMRGRPRLLGRQQLALRQVAHARLPGSVAQPSPCSAPGCGGRRQCCFCTSGACPRNRWCVAAAAAAATGLGSGSSWMGLLSHPLDTR